MYICVCNAVTDHQIRQAVENGVRNMRELRFATGCSTQCGSCECDAEAVMREALAEQDHFRLLEVVSPLGA